MNRKAVAAVIVSVLLLLTVMGVVVRIYGDMPGPCMEELTACCPDDYPDACNDAGTFLGSNKTCTQCTTGPGSCMTYACFCE